MSQNKLGGKFIKGNNLSTEDALSQLGGKIKTLRINANATQGDLSLHCGVSLTVVQRIEGGKSISTQNLIKILRSLGALSELMALYQEPEISLEDKWNLKQKKLTQKKQRVRR